jgi:hypothetical protein
MYGAPWFNADNFGTSWMITDLKGEIYYYAGQLCTGNYIRSRSLAGKPPPGDAGKGVGLDAGAAGGGGGGGAGGNEETQVCVPQLQCGMKYVFRVTGNKYKYKELVAWDFCGVHGYAQSELTFIIVCNEADGQRKRALLAPNPPDGAGEGGADGAGDGEGGAGDEGGGGDKDYEGYEQLCVPILLETNVTECLEHLHGSEGAEESYITLQGTIRLDGLDSKTLSVQEGVVIRRTLMESFNNAGKRNSLSENDVSVLSWSHTTAESETKHASRSLESQHAGQLSFQVKVPSHRMGVTRHETGVMSDFVAGVQNYVQESMTNGIFLATLQSEARKAMLLSMKSVNYAEVIEMFVIHETKLNEEVSNMANVVVSVGALMGVLFGAILYKSYSLSYVSADYTALQSSEHQA